MKRIFYLLSFLLLFSILTAQTVNLVRIEKLAEQIVGESVVKKIFEKAKIPLKIEEYPALRCNQLATSGERDGEMMRIFTYGVRNPTLIRVPTPYYYLETTVFINEADKNRVVVKKKEDLANYKIAIVRGVQHTADMTEGLQNVTIVDDSLQMMKMLEAKRVDIALANRIDGLGVIKMNNIKGVIDSTVLTNHSLYIYFHPNKKDLVDKIDAVIQSVKKSGELDKWVKESEENYLKNIK